MNNQILSSSKKKSTSNFETDNISISDFLLVISRQIKLIIIVTVFFIAKKHEQIIEKIKNQVPSAIFPEINSQLSCQALVTALSSRLDQAISIDNGIMHMIGLANIPMIVLFGPTNSEKFAPKNNYTKILDSKKIHDTSNIESISVEEVYNLI